MSIKISGFSHVDGSESPSGFGAYLRSGGDLEPARVMKSRCHGLLDLRQNERVLDLGCGIGVDLARFAAQVMPGGEVVGLDASEVLLSQARGDGLPAGVTVVAGDATQLPFNDRRFDAVHVGRVLMHVPDMVAVLRELTRVTARGGRAVLCEIVADTFRITPNDAPFASAVEAAGRRVGVHPNAGRAVAGVLSDLGWCVAVEEPYSFVLTDYAAYGRIGGFEPLLAACMASGTLDAGGVRAFQHEMAARVKEFSISVEYRIVLGMRRG